MPHCYPVGLERFREAFVPVLEGGESPRRLSNERVFVAMNKGEPVGFVHVADYCREEEPVRGAIRFLLYRPCRMRRSSDTSTPRSATPCRIIERSCSTPITDFRSPIGLTGGRRGERERGRRGDAEMRYEIRDAGCGMRDARGGAQW